MSKSHYRVKAADIIICDGIREEANGKMMLLGVYPSGVAVPQLPAAIPLAIWIVFECSDKGDFQIELEVIGPDGQRKIDIKAGFSNELGVAGGRAPIGINPLPFELTQTGEAVIRFRESGQEDWHIIKTFPIELKAQTSIEPRKVP